MDFVKNYRELKKKNGAQMTKELSRRGLTVDDCGTTEEIICKIIAYDAYHAGRSAALEELREKNKNVAPTTATERFGIVLKDEANDTVSFLKITKDQRRLLRYLIDHDWLADVSFTETNQIGWDEP